MIELRQGETEPQRRLESHLIALRRSRGWAYAYCTANFPLGGQPVGSEEARAGRAEWRA